MAHNKKRISIFKFIKDMGSRLKEHDIFTYSASLSFYMLLSIIPLVFISIAAVGEVFGKSKEVTLHGIKWIKDIFPFMTIRMEESIYGLVENRGLFGGIGIFSLLWAAHMVLAEGEKVIRKVFGVQRKRWLITSYFIAWSIFLLSIIFLTTSFLLGLLLGLIRDNLLPPPILNTLVPFIDSFFIKYTPAAMVALTVAASYKFLPQRKVPLSLALSGGISFAALWEIAKKLFFIYMSRVDYFSLIYGSLGALMMFLLFVFYSAMLFIFIAEILACVLDMQEEI